jgi:hypothetical protein
MNPSHHGSDEQVFGAKQQVLRGARGLRSRLPMNGGYQGKDGGALLAAPEHFTGSKPGRPNVMA